MVAVEVLRAMHLLIWPQLSGVLLSPRGHLLSHPRPVSFMFVWCSRVGSVLDCVADIVGRSICHEGTLWSRASQESETRWRGL